MTMHSSSTQISRTVFAEHPWELHPPNMTHAQKPDTRSINQKLASEPMM